MGRNEGDREPAAGGLWPGEVLRLEAAQVRGAYLEPDGSRLPRYAVPGPYRVEAQRGETVELVSVLTGDRFETTAAALGRGV